MRKIKYLAKLIIPSTCILALLSLVIGGAFSVLQTQTNSVENTFDLVYMDIAVIEPLWDAEAGHVYSSGETFAKDPQVSNIGSRDIYTYISVFVPDNPLTDEEDEIFSYNYNSADWTVLCKDLTFDTENNYIGTTTYYSYNAIVKAGENTTPVFEAMTFAEYDIDEENLLEDEESSGEGEGSLILGKTFDVIVNGYAVTTDVNTTMEENALKDYETSSVIYNCGIGTAWNYLTQEVKNNLEDGEEIPAYTNVVPETNTFTVEICDYEGNIVDNITLYSADGDSLSLEVINSYMNLINVPKYKTTKDMYNNILDVNGNELFSEESPLDTIADENNVGSFKLRVNLQYAFVYITLVQDGNEIAIIPLMFEDGEIISNETISTKLSETVGTTISITTPEINEVAKCGDEYSLSIDISAIINQ